MTPSRRSDPPPILPIGTKIVTRVALRNADGIETRPAGNVAVIVRSPSDPQHRYRIRFADDEVVTLRRHEMDVFARHQDDAIRGDDHGEVNDDYFNFVIYRCIVGSRAYGLDDEASDVDVRGIYLPPARLHWSLTGVPDSIERDDADECYWELERFVVLALKANPNILECLYTPLVEHATEVAKELLDIRSSFLSRFIHKTYNGYVLSQFKKLQRSRENGHEPNWKHAMHLLRLLLSGAGALETGSLRIDVGVHRDRLREVKRGDVAWEDVDAWRIELQRGFDERLRDSPLPERPDYRQANDFVIRARRSMVEEDENS